MTYIGMTEAGDAGLDLSWYDKALGTENCAGVVLITKGVSYKPFQEKVLDFIKHKPAMLHAGITGWGGTPMEPNVATAETSIEGARRLIDNGFPADHVILRIDPIFLTKAGLERAQHVITLARNILPDVGRIRISIYDDYFRAREEIIKRGYQPIDNITKWKNEMERRPTATQVKDTAEALIAAARPDQIFEVCAEPEIAQAYPDRFKWFGCLSRTDCRIMGIEYPENVGINGQNRFGCRCIRMKRELLSHKTRCPHNCAYCYWGRPQSN